MIPLVIAGICSVPTTTFAEDPLNFYLGAGAGDAEVRRDPLFGSDFDEHHFGWKAIAGIRPLSPVGAELEYIDFGKPSAGPSDAFTLASSNAKAAALFGLGYLPLPIPFLDIYGKLGVARLHSSSTVLRSCSMYLECPAQMFGTFHQDLWSTDVAYGVGAQASLGQFALRTEYERISASGGNPSLLSLSVAWGF